MGTSSSDKQFHLQYLSYRRPFNRPMGAAWGTWAIREGLILKLEQEEWEHPRFGEIAPLPEFGSESIGTARAFLDGLGENPARRDLQNAILEAPVATASGLSQLFIDPDTGCTARTSALLGLRDATPTLLADLSSNGFSTFKVKLGLDEPDVEWKMLQSLVSSLSQGQQLRLDPNGSWDDSKWRFWKNRLDEVSGWIEFLEEPFCSGLSPSNWMQHADISPVPFALDESLSNGSLIDWCKLGWSGYWIIKPSLLGNPDRWLSPLSNYRKRVIISSVFETGIGLSGLVHLAGEFPGRDHGLGTQAWFDDSIRTVESGATLSTLDIPGQEAIWNQLSAD